MIELRPPRALRAALAALAVLATWSALLSAWPAVTLAVPVLLTLAWPRGGVPAVVRFGSDGSVLLDGRPVRSFALREQGSLAVLELDSRHHLLRADRALRLWFEAHARV